MYNIVYYFNSDDYYRYTGPSMVYSICGYLMVNYRINTTKLVVMYKHYFIDVTAFYKTTVHVHALYSCYKAVLMYCTFK